jgi:hypothetical protein
MVIKASRLLVARWMWAAMGVWVVGNPEEQTGDGNAGGIIWVCSRIAGMRSDTAGGGDAARPRRGGN